MKNRELQEKRMRGYFIQATKDILKGEGLASVNVRGIADQAGYSYATLYNYFNDINDLVFECVNDFQEECLQFVTEKAGDKSQGIDKLRAKVLAYVRYFVEYPGIFEIFYLARGGDFGNKKSIIEVIGRSLDNVCQEEWDYLKEQKIYSPEQIERLKAQLRYSVIGLLLLYLNRLTPANYKEFMEEANAMIDFQLEG
jgi:AcrR family transcriptional regulator